MLYKDKPIFVFAAFPHQNSYAGFFILFLQKKADAGYN